jgi:hypothetical protein
VTAALKAHKRDQATRRLALGPAWHEHDMVLPGPAGEPCDHAHAIYGFGVLCKRAGLGDGWTRYATSHTFVSQLSGQAVDLELIADAVGNPELERHPCGLPARPQGQDQRDGDGVRQDHVVIGARVRLPARSAALLPPGQRPVGGFSNCQATKFPANSRSGANTCQPGSGPERQWSEKDRGPL